jgi:ABC-type branched-subunit amino acid transport system substrate-binding protein
LLITLVSTSCTVQHVTRPVLKIGLVAPFEGYYRYVGYDAIYAARLALRQANGIGETGRYTVELTAYDDRGTADGARVAARNLALDPQVVAVIGHFREETTAAAREIYTEVGLPLIVAGTVEGGVGAVPELLCVLLEYLSQTSVPSSRRAQWISSEDIRWPCQQAPLVSHSVEVPPPSDIDTLLLTLDPLTASEIVTALDRVGWGGIVAGGPTLGSPLFARTADSDGVIFVTPYRWPDSTGKDAGFAAEYESLGPHVPRPGPYAVTTYEVTQTLLGVIEGVASRGEAPSRATLSRHPFSATVAAVYVYEWTGADTPVLRMVRTSAGEQ